VTVLNADNLPWVLLGGATTALSTVFYAMLRGKIISSRVADKLLESAEKRAEVAETGMAANTESVKTLVEQVGKLTVFAENQDKLLRALRDRAGRGDTRNRGGSS
jgi:predicted phage tail protein